MVCKEISVCEHWVIRFIFTNSIWLLLGQTSFSIDNDAAQIQTEIYKNGPVEAAFTVYGDFPNYKTGKFFLVSVV